MVDDSPREKYATVYRLLVDAYGEPIWQSHGPPLDELVGTILSQATADINTERAYQALRAQFPTWEEVMAAPAEAIVAAIRPAGLANMKGPRIQNALRYIYRERGELSLDFLADRPLDEAMAWLTQIEGVGPKTASIVLLFSLGRPAFPVDTHVHRVTGRLGLIPPRMNAEQAHGRLADLGLPQTYYAMHLNLIRHGRRICRARGPHCAICPLQGVCAYYQATVSPANRE